MTDEPSTTTEPATDEPQGEPAAGHDPSSQRRAWSMPGPPVTRKQVDQVGRIALKAGTGGAKFIADAARYGARSAGQLGRAIDTVPPTLRLLALMGALILLGILGAIALNNSLGLACVVVVVPLCSITFGALGHRWYSGLDSQPTHRADSLTAERTTTDLQRSVEYVDKKLTVALNSFGAERHQHAMIALFQAKTAVELTLGTEQDTASHVDAFLSVDDQSARPRIRVGSVSKSSLREGNSLVAS